MHVWYASYGSNLCRDRFLCYVRGGRPPGASRGYGGARDSTLPTEDRPLTLPGEVFFGWTSRTWGGGIAFYDADSTGTALARAYRVTSQQLADVAAQEMRREPGEDLDLAQVMETSRQDLGRGRYAALHLVGELDGEPVLTFTAPDPAALEHRPPAPAYLAMLARGLGESHGLSGAEVVSYLRERPGLGPDWDEGRLGELVSDAVPR
jgi:hypothetical protein